MNLIHINAADVRDLQYHHMRVFFAIALGIVGVFAATPDSLAENIGVERGHALVKDNCGGCHAVGLTDDSTHPEAPPFRAVMKSYAASSLSEALAEGLVTGHPDMPEFIFPAEDVGAIVEYLHSLEEP